MRLNMIVKRNRDWDSSWRGKARGFFFCLFSVIVVILSCRDREIYNSVHREAEALTEQEEKRWRRSR